jgi:hypothetical protein
MPTASGMARAKQTAKRNLLRGAAFIEHFHVAA